MKQNLLSTAEAAELLGVSIHTIRRMIHRRELPFLLVSGQYRISSSRLEAWVQTNTVEPQLPAERVA